MNLDVGEYTNENMPVKDDSYVASPCAIQGNIPTLQILFSQEILLRDVCNNTIYFTIFKHLNLTGF